jgi:hypothetical protein
MQADSRLPLGGNVNKSQNPGMGLAVNDGQLSEILVKRDQDPLFLMGPRQNFFVSGILFPVRRCHDIQTMSRELLARATPDATVQEELQPSVPVAISRGSTRSCPTSLRA